MTTPIKEVVTRETRNGVPCVVLTVDRFVKLMDAAQIAEGYMRELERRTRTPEINLKLRICIDRLMDATAGVV